MNKLLAWIFRIFAFLILALPSKMRWGLAKFMGRLARFLLRARARLTLENLLAAGYDPNEAKRISVGVWEALGLVGAEFIYYIMGDVEALEKAVTWEGIEHLEAALAKGKGAIIVSAHLGNWELLGAALTRKYPVVAIAREQGNAEFDKIISEARKKVAKMVPMRASLKPLISALRHNELAYFIVDQRGRGVHCEFMGRETRFYVGAATFALRTGAALIPARVIRVQPEQYRLVIDPAVEPVESGDFEADVKATTVRIMKVLEGQIRENPEQWLWMHKLWPSKIKV
ncbi:MAG TPA: lysophospholipid acyltransferase family protein [Bacillota bacterium]|mgnify:CR=1 FL=1|jgi:KDO2-lipid IV(A) lauroyltransferase|nr:lysophospholipid acyltransferase family protein [Bacillota bacterium]